MLNKQQNLDYKRCEEMQLQGEDMDCLDCSCSVCMVQAPADYTNGLKKAKKLIEKEIEFAKQVNCQMAIGMLRALKLIEKELDR